MAKVVVVGLDGVGWGVIREWLEKGELPNLRKLLRGGSSCVLETVLPPLTCPAWKCYSTGKNPAKFGVFSRTELDFGSGSIRDADSTAYKSKEIWDCLGEKGLKSAVIDMPTTYPPKKVNGFMVASIEPPDRVENYTYPLELQAELEQRLGFRPDLENSSEFETAELEKDIFSLIDTRFALAIESLPKVDFLHMTIVYTDYIMHFHWRKDFVKRVYRKIDCCLGELAGKIGSDGVLIVMSDHGFSELKARFFANTWLQQKGYMKVREGFSEKLFRLGVNKDSLLGFFKRLGLAGFVKGVTPKKVTRQLKSRHGLVDGPEKSGLFDWKNSSVICHANDLFFVNPKEKDRESIKQQLKRELLEISYPPTGEKVVEKVFDGREIYRGEFSSRAPDLVVQAKPWFEVCSALGSEKLFDSECGWKAIHQKDGILVASGRGIRKGFEFGKASILDLAPTILHLMGQPIPKDLDGRVLKEILAEKNAGERKGFS